MVQLESLSGPSLMGDRVYNVLKNEILKRNFKPGDTLNIVAISRQLNVSNGPVREALNMLSKDGLVILAPYKKAVVAQGSPEDLSTVSDLRCFLEPYAARTCINNIPEEVIDEVEVLLDAVLEEPEDYRLYLDSDIKFHEMIYKHSHSELLISVLDSVRVYTMRFYTEILESMSAKVGSTEEAVRQTTIEHKKMLELVRKRDGDALADALLQHIKGVHEELLTTQF